MDQNETPTNAEIDELADEIAETAAHLDAATHRLLSCIRLFDEKEGWGRHGALSCAHWLSWRIGLDLATAREKVRVARAIGKLPVIDAALEKGQLSYAKVRAMTRIATPEIEGRLVEMALQATGAQLEQICRGYRRVAPERALPADERETKRTVRRSVMADGMVKIEVVLEADEAAVVMKALEAAGSSLRCEAHTPSGGVRHPKSAEPDKRPRPTRADALMAVAESFLARGAASGSGGDRFEVLVHLEKDVLGPDGTFAATLEDGTQLSAETFRRVTCDCSLVGVVVDENGQPLDVGRRTRSFPPAIRRALWVRDRGCSWPGCENKVFVQGHHIDHWAHGGETSVRNGALLCHPHHLLVHEGGWRIEHGPGGALSFRRPDGRLLESAPVEVTREAVEVLAGEHARAGLDIHARIQLPAWDGTPPDYDVAIGSLFPPIAQSPGVPTSAPVRELSVRQDGSELALA